MMDEFNKSIYKENKIVELYAISDKLQPPEETLLNFFKHELANMSMLDIGVGGGRTTKHFAKVVREYIGIDYSEEMVAICDKIFTGYCDNISFKVCDVRNMEMFPSNSFDLVLFSYNGIDYICHEDRINAFAEICRVGKTGGHFFFSTHNPRWLYKIFEFKRQLSFNPGTLFRNLIRWALIKYNNRHTDLKSIMTSHYSIIDDGSYGLKTYYIRPSEQYRQLMSYFDEVHIYSLHSGLEVMDRKNLDNFEDAWFYYLCTFK